MTLDAFLARFPTERACWLEILKYKRCCGQLYALKNRPAYLCVGCLKNKSLFKGTIFEETRAPIKQWFYAMWRLSESKSGISAMQLQRETGMGYNACWRMLHKIRLNMRENLFFKGSVEVDETYIGGKRKMRAKYWYGDDPKRKQILFGIAQRKTDTEHSKVKAHHVPNIGGKTLLPKILQGIKKGTHINSDGYSYYAGLPKHGFTHSSVDHKFRFVDGDTSTQNIECLWSQIKRRINGTHHSIGKHYLQLYVYEAEWKWNHRNDLFLPLLEKSIVKFGGLESQALAYS